MTEVLTDSSPERELSTVTIQYNADTINQAVLQDDLWRDSHAYLVFQNMINNYNPEESLRSLFAALYQEDVCMEIQFADEYIQKLFAQLFKQSASMLQANSGFAVITSANSTDTEKSVSLLIPEVGYKLFPGHSLLEIQHSLPTWRIEPEWARTFGIDDVVLATLDPISSSETGQKP